MTAETARHRPRRRTLALAALSAMVAVASLPAAWSFASASPSPGSFIGYGFDACQAPDSNTMDAWMNDPSNPYRAIGIYISGGLRGCSQPNLSSAWVNHNQAAGWHLLPIDVGPQASCNGFRQSVDPTPTNNYANAQAQGRAEADTAAATARSLALAPASTIFYDMEGWAVGNADCDASALWFMSAWTNELHKQGYAGGVYSSGSSGITLLNQVANNRVTGFSLPDQIWFAEWNGNENTASPSLNPGNWANHQRVHQYYGGHDATNGGITLNIDSNYMDVATQLSPPPPPPPAPAPVISRATVVPVAPASVPNSTQAKPVQGAQVSTPPAPAPSPTPAARPTVAPTVAPPSPRPVAAPPAPAAPSSPAKPVTPPPAPVTAQAATPPTPPTGVAPTSIGIKPRVAAPAPVLPPAQQHPLTLTPGHPLPPAPKPAAPAPSVPATANNSQVQAPVQAATTSAPPASPNDAAIPLGTVAPPKPQQYTTLVDRFVTASHTLANKMGDLLKPAAKWLSKTVGGFFGW